MKYLLDTHTLLWATAAKERLSNTTRDTIENNKGNVFVSQISLWVIAIKHKIGKLPDFALSLEQFVETILADGFSILPLYNRHLVAYFNCPYFAADHKDPFDRLLIVTAEVEKAGFITKDEKFSLYRPSDYCLVKNLRS